MCTYVHSPEPGSHWGIFLKSFELVSNSWLARKLRSRDRGLAREQDLA